MFFAVIENQFKIYVSTNIPTALTINFSTNRGSSKSAVVLLWQGDGKEFFNRTADLVIHFNWFLFVVKSTVLPSSLSKGGLY